MADVATPPAAQTPAAEGSAPQAKQPVVKPEKPDEAKFREELDKVEKEHTAAQDKLVSTCPRSSRIRTVAREQAVGWLHHTRELYSADTC
jgi:hypothetical protein